MEDIRQYIWQYIQDLYTYDQGELTVGFFILLVFVFCYMGACFSEK